MSAIQPDKPLSPHLQIYRLPLTVVLSVLHRMTGILLSLGLAVLVIWLVALATDAQAYQWLHACFATWVGQILLIGWTAALYFHLCNGIRHLVWDIGLGFDLVSVDRSAVLAIVVTILLTTLTWMIVLASRGTI